ncbi:TIGR04222 domain-containing membrane protein [Actinomycetospora aeridis]|uniref:TIGR04222 domain-containing membrane protein n=1 Tax=Actinomycetospora aeridis TaxID=3129231 RepID=A0ABU8N1K6_9PSEU
MGNTWGISGPAFLGIYALLLVASALVAPVLVRRLDWRVARRDGEAPAPDATVEDLALLAGGPARLVQAAIARLVEGGVLRVGRDRHLTVTGRAPIGELDEDVVDAVASTPTGVTPMGVTMRMRGAASIRDLREASRRRGLFHDPAAVARCRTVAFVVVGLVVVLGLARLAAGIARGASIVFLVILVLVAVGVVLTVAVVPKDRPTLRGRATVAAARATTYRPVFASDRAWGPVAAGALGVAGLVAVGGFAMYPNDELSGLLAGPSMSGGGGYDGGGSDGGSSCGGSSSCGGGGGGGCGGGGGGCGG